MALGVVDRVAVEEVAALADSFADLVVGDLNSITSLDELRAALSGSYLVFLREAVVLAHSLHE
jgi:hypothetical protein